MTVLDSTASVVPYPPDAITTAGRSVAYLLGRLAASADVAEEGVDAATVARAPALHLMILTGLSAPLLGPPGADTDPGAFAHEALERAAISRFALHLVEATSG